MERLLRGHISSLPPELLTAIIRDVFSEPSAFPHPPHPVYASSPLELRLLLFRGLSLVHRAFHLVCRDVFFEDVPALTQEAIKGLTRTFAEDSFDEGLRNRLLETEISFTNGYQESKCTPRKPRVRHDGAIEGIGPQKRIEWRPSVVAQSAQWNAWQGEVKSLFTRTPSLRKVSVNMTCQLDGYAAFKYGQKWPLPSLSMRTLLSGLLACSNLRSLELVDPVPLEAWGTALQEWTKLDRLVIVLATPQMSTDLPETAFCPPKSLTSFEFHDYVCAKPWPLVSDLARCTNLQRLTLCARSLVSVQTKAAVAFLLHSYKDTLEHLAFFSHDAPDGGPPSAASQAFVDILSGHDADGPIAMSKLKSLVLDAVVLGSRVAEFRMPHLEVLAVEDIAEKAGVPSIIGAWRSSLRGLPSLRSVYLGLRMPGIIDKIVLSDFKAHSIDLHCGPWSIDALRQREFREF